MKKTIIIFFTVILLTMMLIGEDQPEKLKVGLLDYSINTFDEEKETIKESWNKILKALVKILKQNFEYTLRDSKPINYSDIEDPEVSISPEVKPETNRKLQEICEKENLDGIVFGHYYQEDKLIVVSRFYISKNSKAFKGITDVEQILSGVEVEMSEDDLNERSLKEHTLNSLTDLIDKIRVKQESFKTIVPTLPTNVGVSGTQPTKPAKTSPQKSAASPKKDPLTEKEKNMKGIVETLTFREVYQMISDNGFYCEIVKGSPPHENALKSIKNVPKNGRFPLKRLIDTSREGTYVLKTTSIQDFDCKTCEKRIELRWNTEYLEKCSFKKANKIIGKLNPQKNNSNWRIPTAMELLSIVRPNTRDHFPNEFFTIPKRFKNKDLLLWTSTILKDQNGREKHCVIKSRYNKIADVYWLHFTFVDITEKKNAIILPVSSDHLYAYHQPDGKIKLSESQEKIPGFDDTTGKLPKNKSTASTRPIPKLKNNSPNPPSQPVTQDKIPGFDDVQEGTQKKPSTRTKPKSSTSNKSSSNNSQDIPGFSDNPKPKYKKHNAKNSSIFKRKKNTVNIALFPHYSVKRSSAEIKMLKSLNNRIEGNLDILKHQIRANFGDKIKIKKMRHETKDINIITGLYTRLSSRLSNIQVREDVLENIIHTIMIPENIDIIVTVKYSPGNRNDRNRFTLIVIDKFEPNLDVRLNFATNTGEVPYESMATEAARGISIIFNKLHIRKNNQWNDRSHHWRGNKRL